MSMGRRQEQRQADLWIATTDLPKSPGHVFYEKLNRLLADADFDQWLESLCQPYYADGVGRDSIPPGTYFRMLFVGYFEDLDSQRAIAWRCGDSFSLRDYRSRLFSDIGVSNESCPVSLNFWEQAQLRESRLDRLAAWTPSSNSNRICTTDESMWIA